MFPSSSGEYHLLSYERDQLILGVLSVARVGDYIYIEGGSVGQYVGNVTSLKGGKLYLHSY
jgi:hypothetical protein